jgi:hypothetical protein
MHRDKTRNPMAQILGTRYRKRAVLASGIKRS